MFQALSPPIIRSSKTVHTASGSGSSKQAWHIPDAVCTVFELLMMGFSAHHQELKNSTHSIWYIPSLLSSGAQKLYTHHLVYAKLACCYRYQMLCVQFLNS